MSQPLSEPLYHHQVKTSLNIVVVLIQSVGIDLLVLRSLLLLKQETNDFFGTNHIIPQTMICARRSLECASLGKKGIMMSLRGIATQHGQRCSCGNE